MQIAVLCPSEIAYRRFMPALQLADDFEFGGIGVATNEERYVGQTEYDICEANEKTEKQRAKAQQFVDNYGGSVFESFTALIENPEIDAIYIPLPPALHYRWAKRALEAGKHVFVEKPFTTTLADTSNLIALAQAGSRAVHENYMFAFHSQIEYLKHAIDSGLLGDIRLIRIDFGFPFRGSTDFRYSKELGGGALLDCGGYTLKLAAQLLGPSTSIKAASSSSTPSLDVDIAGSATLENEDGLVAQVSFGMDNDYRCSIDVWGSTGTLRNGRILTAPANLEPVFTISRNGTIEEIKLPADDSFRKSIERFRDCIRDESIRMSQMQEIELQARLVEEFAALAGKR